jgi:hypothetical protein
VNPPIRVTRYSLLSRGHWNDSQSHGSCHWNDSQSLGSCHLNDSQSRTTGIGPFVNLSKRDRSQIAIYQTGSQLPALPSHQRQQDALAPPTTRQLPADHPTGTTVRRARTTSGFRGRSPLAGRSPAGDSARWAGIPITYPCHTVATRGALALVRGIPIAYPSHPGGSTFFSFFFGGWGVGWGAFAKLQTPTHPNLRQSPVARFDWWGLEPAGWAQGACMEPVVENWQSSHPSSLV